MIRERSELRRRAMEGLAAEVAAFGSGALDSRVTRRDGVLAAITPATPGRSLFNSVYYKSDLVGRLRVHLGVIAPRVLLIEMLAAGVASLIQPP